MSKEKRLTKKLAKKVKKEKKNKVEIIEEKKVVTESKPKINKTDLSSF